MKNNKLILLGFDGASFDVIFENMNKLPTFKQLLQDSCHGVLESVTPPITIPVFPCLATSKNPEHFGIYTFYIFNKDTRGLKLWKETKLEDRFWDVLSENEYRSILFNIPASYPFKEGFNGSIVAAAPEAGKKTYSHPPELWSELNKIVDDGFKLRPENSAVNPEYLEEIKELEDKRIKAIEHLLENKNWNFAMLFFRQTDRVAHRWWYTDELLKAYQRADNHLNKIISNHNCDTIIFSDHGFEGIHTTINLSYIFKKEGLIKLKGKKPHRRFLAWLREKVSIFAKKHGFISTLRRIIPQQIIEKTPYGNTLSWFNVLSHKMVDFAKTDVMPINAGKVVPLFVFKNRERVIKTIRDNLNKLGFEYELKELNYNNPRVPDLILEAKDKGCMFSTNFDANEPVSKVTKSTHNRDGILIAKGESFKNGKVEGARIIDIAPTILHYFGLPIPLGYEGKILKQIFREDVEAAKRPVKYKNYERDRVKKRIEMLRKMGKV